MTKILSHSADMHKVEIIKDRLYFATLSSHQKPSSSTTCHFFNTDEELVYNKFYEDFGPLCLSAVYRYICLINKKLKSKSLRKRKLIHYVYNASKDDQKKRVNAAFLIGTYMIVQLKMAPDDTFSLLNSNGEFVSFRDASYGPCTFMLTLLDCFNGFHKALQCGFFNMDTFDSVEYEHYEKVENGDFNWIVPGRFLAFCGPHAVTKIEKGSISHGPESYLAYFKNNGITAVIRLNKKVYDAEKFTENGIAHYDLYFADGCSPTDSIMEQFISICEGNSGAVAVHCKAGLGRTGTLIGCYLMKHYKFTAREAIAWMRIARPGSVIGPQQQYMERKEKRLWNEGESFNINHQQCGSDIVDVQPELIQIETGVGDIDIVKENCSLAISQPHENQLLEGEEELTQGDCLNFIKFRRSVAPDPRTTSSKPYDSLRVKSSFSSKTKLKQNKVSDSTSEVKVVMSFSTSRPLRMKQAVVESDNNASSCLRVTRSSMRL